LPWPRWRRWRHSYRLGTSAKIDAAAERALADSGAPSVSIAIVKDGRIASVKAYGKARLDPATAAAPEMRYSIGLSSSESLPLLGQHQVGRYLPHLTRANGITIRQLLTHTSGYQDYYPLDFVADFMKKPATADEILQRWAGKALDFDPGTRWQYSNTNFVAAGRILERVSACRNGTTAPPGPPAAGTACVQNRDTPAATTFGWPPVEGLTRRSSSRYSTARRMVRPGSTRRHSGLTRLQ